MAAKLYEMGRLSSGVAAQLAGVPRAEFLLDLRRFGAAVMNYTAEELESDIANA